MYTTMISVCVSLSQAKNQPIVVRSFAHLRRARIVIQVCEISAPDTGSPHAELALGRKRRSECVFAAGSVWQALVEIRCLENAAGYRLSAGGPVVRSAVAYSSGRINQSLRA